MFINESGGDNMKSITIEKRKLDMKGCADKLNRLDQLDQMVVAAKIDALYDRQMIEKEMSNGKKAG